jgi:Tol biopolymer transport system component
MSWTPIGAPTTRSPSPIYVDGHFRIEYPIGHSLYEPATGWLTNVRVSPKGDWVAFAEHPTLGDSAGDVVMVDSSGHKRMLSRRQSSIVKVNWAPSGKEVWFTSSEESTKFQLRATDLSGHTRVVDRIPAAPTLYDIARDGRVLLGQTIFQILAYAQGIGQNRERDMTIQNWSDASAISPDGRQLLLNEEGPNSGPITTFTSVQAIAQRPYALAMAWVTISHRT